MSTKHKSNLFVGVTFIGLIAALGFGSIALEKKVAAQNKAAKQAPVFEVDPFWPKPLPNNWRIGSAIGVSADAQDNIWIIHRPDTLNPRTERYASLNPPGAACCSPAPPVLKFDASGKMTASWGGKGEGYDWPVSNHGITVDYKGNVWIGGNGARPEGAPQGQQVPYADAQILKFTQAGKFLMQIGKSGQSQGSNDTANLKGPAKIFVDAKTNEVYVADGYGNKRVVVYDADSGTYKRHWGAYGNKPDDTNIGRYNPDAPPAQQFRTPVHCAELSVDNLLYVCDRPNDRIQVFQKDGKFVKEVFVAKRTLGDGSVWDIAFSKDPQQKYIYLADGANEKIYVIERETMEILTSFGAGGRQPGQFYAVHSIATDSKGNIFTTETYEGKRLQKFVFKGMAPVTTMDQGTPWPKTASR